VHAEHASTAVAAGREARQGLVDGELLAADKDTIGRPAPGGDALRRAPVSHYQRLKPHIDSLTIHLAAPAPEHHATQLLTGLILQRPRGRWPRISRR